MMTEERIIEILRSDMNPQWDGDNTFQGFMILAKYFDPAKETIVGAAEHDIVFGPSISKLAERGITEVDVVAMRMLNWMEEYDAIACFV